MSKKLQWATYTGKQAGQVIAGLQLLIDSDVLSKEEEEELAKGIQRKLKRTSMEGKEYTMVPLTEEEMELVNQVEAALWR